MAKKKHRNPTLKAPVVPVTSARMAKAIGVKEASITVDSSGLRESLLSTATPPVIGFTNEPQVVDTRTPLQKEIEQCGETYRQLIDSHPELIDLVACLIAFRRCHAVAYREMHDLLLRITAAGITVPPLFADFVTMLFLEQADRPFDTHELMSGMVDVVTKWMANTMDRHTAADEAEAQAAQQKELADRLSASVPIGFRYSVSEDETLERSRTLVLVGWRNAVLWLLDRAARTTSATGTVVQFATRAPQRHEQNSRLIRVAPDSWAGFANSDRALATTVVTYVAPTIGSPIDLITCGDLSLGLTNTFVGRPAAASAGDAHRRLRKWCDDIGAAIMAAIPVDGFDVPDVTAPEFYQLNTFATVRVVYVREVGDNYQVVIGNDASVFEVPRAELDAYGSLLLLPK